MGTQNALGDFSQQFCYYCKNMVSICIIKKKFKQLSLELKEVINLGFEISMQQAVIKIFPETELFRCPFQSD